MDELETEVVSEAVELTVPEEEAILSGVELPAEETAVSATEGVAIDEAHFPDATFRQKVLNSYDPNRDGKLSEVEQANTGYIFVSESGIKSLKGIELFPNLTDLYCYDNSVTELDLSDCPDLFSISCYGNRIKTLDITNNKQLHEFAKREPYIEDGIVFLNSGDPGLLIDPDTVLG